MSRIFITGSSDGLGLLAGQILLEQGHHVVLHARNATRARETDTELPGSDAIVVGDLSTIQGIKTVAAQCKALGGFDAVIHNVGLGVLPEARKTVDGISELFAVNVVAPYLLTALMMKPRRLVYLSSDMHRGGNEVLSDPQWEQRPWNPAQAYADTKLYDLILAMGIARRWPEIFVNAVDPGWVPTRMGGPHAPDDLWKGAFTQAWLSVSKDREASVSGKYFHHQKSLSMKAAALQAEVQENLFTYLKQLTDVSID
jgi:NAD(P)-dependent dehydrogenase (short-subunit alcohol dehydrogenase family)